MDQHRLVLINIAGDDAALSAHSNGCGKALAARCRAAVQHRRPLLRELGAEHRQPGRRVLHIKEPLFKALQLLDTAGIRKHQAVLHPAMGPGGNTLRGKYLLQLLPSGFQGVHLHHQIRSAVIGLKHLFKALPAQALLQPVYELLRVAVSVRKALWLLQSIPGAHGAAQYRVHKARSGTDAPTIFFRKAHRLIDCRRIRDPIRLIKLIQAQMEDIPDSRMQTLQLAGQQLL